MSSIWLMSPSLGDKGVSFQMMDPVSGNKYYLDTSLGCGDFLRICYSSDGWLLVYGDETSNKRLKLSLYNPITKSIVGLPELNFMGQYMLTCSTDTPNCRVIGISSWESHLNFIEFDWNDSEKQCKWDSVDVEREDDAEYIYVTQSNINPACIEDKDYYFLVGGDGDLASYVYNKEKGSFYLRIHHIKFPCHNFEQRFIVAGCDDKTILSIYVGGGMKWLRVFKWDRSKMANEWVEVGNLGNHNIYLSTVSCICREVEFPAKGNKIYFPRFHDGRIVYYSLNTCKFHAGEGDSSTVVDYNETMEPLQCCWFEPNLGLK